MATLSIHHYTLMCSPAQLDALVDFYTRVLRLEIGPRPALPAPGAWLYAEGQPLVHIYAGLTIERMASAGMETGALDHISFRCRGLQETKAHLRKHGIVFDELPVPGRPIYQLFLRDLQGLKIELTFFLEEEHE
ncbi:hypothetical protein [Cupriavidus consociatus]|uniref:hypothetical protein n=1 Tax=Cupriavidus consociatus TaxID=2821357 RepID=UPI001AE8AAF6|nr:MULTISPECIES: hypothetical protein [unclassified Cupriavidus]MBP0625202.1 hypothetical protein [Cupriavidus sp. LEh25]MDK2661942.1 hypothetical protein [Cupriavidus sp. LEh21]